MELYRPGKVPWHESQLLYHALGELGRDALCLVSPATPYVCIGFHQDAAREVDLAYCISNHIPVFRRDVGGGAVYLDGNQLFFQLVLQKDNPLVPKSNVAFYKKFLQPVINVYHRIGIPAQYKPVNDLIAGTRKISGTGVGEIGECIAFVGNLIVDFDYQIMARILKAPDEKFRDKVHKTLENNLTTIHRELGEEGTKKWSEERLNSLLVEEFGRLLGPMVPKDKDEALRAKMDELGRRMMTDEWLHRKGVSTGGRHVKIRAGVQVTHRLHKAAGGLIRADFEVCEGKYRSVKLSGDFFCHPEHAVGWLESGLEGEAVTDLGAFLKGFYQERQIETPGINIHDWIEVLAV